MSPGDAVFILFIFLELIAFSALLMGMRISSGLKREHCKVLDSDR